MVVEVVDVGAGTSAVVTVVDEEVDATTAGFVVVVVGGCTIGDFVVTVACTAAVEVVEDTVDDVDEAGTGVDVVVEATVTVVDVAGAEVVVEDVVVETCAWA